MAEVLLKVKNLSTLFRTEGGVVKAVDNISFEVRAGETFALVGESGCGKSVTALSIMRLIPTPPGEITSGTVEFDGIDLLKLRNREMRAIRGSKIGMIFQEPMSSLNPVLPIQSQLAEPLTALRSWSTWWAFPMRGPACNSIHTNSAAASGNGS